jgi:hypothetical protein
MFSSVHMNPVIVSLSHCRVASGDFGSVAKTRLEGTMDGICTTSSMSLYGLSLC